ncbi:MAG: phosphotransferase [Acidobacteria bacterium]|nr:phosphotransferase [Acidobacteriota bacterium]
MSHPTSITAHAFDAPARERIEAYVRRSFGDPKEIVPLTPDASTREYFRVPHLGKTAVAAVYPEPFDPEVHPFIDVTRLFEAAKLPVPAILDVDAGAGIILQEDLGDRQLRRVFETATEDEREAYVERAIQIVADIQAATPLAYERNSIASRLAFDEAKLSWELDFFCEHYFRSYRREQLSHGDEAQLRAELNDIASELAGRPRVLCHRDFHSSNLIVDDEDRLRIIDHQDARMGPASYDLVSLLLDRQTGVPELAEIRQRRLYFLEERKARGLEEIAPEEFASEFRLMTVQRCLKACGTFSYQTGVCGRAEVYEQFIEPMIRIAIQAADWLNRFPALRSTLGARLRPAAT